MSKKQAKKEQQEQHCAHGGEEGQLTAHNYKERFRSLLKLEEQEHKKILTERYVKQQFVAIISV